MKKFAAMLKKFVILVRGRPAISILSLLIVVSGVVAVVFITRPAPSDKGSAGGLSVTGKPSPAPPKNDAEPLRNIAFDVTSLKADKAAGRGIAADSSFVVQTDVDVPIENIKSTMTIEPAVDFTVERTAAKEYVIQVTQPLPENTLVRLTYQNESATPHKWAFQTKQVFNVVSTLPDDKTEYVPVDTGIEVTFSQVGVEPETLKNYFAIAPHVEGTFEKHRSTLVFVPSEPLAYKTLYTVTVKAGFPAASGETLAEDKSFSFVTQSVQNNLWCYLNNDLSESFLPGDPVVVEIHASSAFTDPPFDVKLYRYANTGAQQDALLEYCKSKRWGEEYFFPTKGLDIVYQSQDKLVRSDSGDEWSPSFLPLPAQLPEGYYVADIQVSLYGQTFHLQKRIQVSPISVYASSLPNAAVFFVNDSATGKAVANANISVFVQGQTFTAETGVGGIGQVALSATEGGDGMLSVTDGAHVFLDLFDTRQSLPRSPLEDYFVYLYTDRAVYLSTDTVHVWGVLRPRTDSAVMPPPNLRLYMGYSEEERAESPVTLRPDGTFTAEFSLKNYAERGESVSLMMGETELGVTYINISDYVKPSYVLDAQAPLFVWMPQKDPVTVTVDAAYFDGTPAKNLPLSFDSAFSESTSGSRTVTTDTSGHASVTYTIDDNNTWQPRYVWASFFTSGIENEYQGSSAGFYAFQRDIMLVSDFVKNGSAGNLAVKTYKVDISRLETEEDLWREDHELLQGAPVDTAVHGVLTRNYFEPIETGQYYDFIRKVTVKKYRYEHREVVAGTYDVTTSQGSASFDNLPLDDPDSYYYIDLSWTDTQGQPVEDRIHLGAQLYRVSEDGSGWHNYTLDNENVYNFEEKENITFSLLDNGMPVNPSGGRIFYAVSRSDFLKTATVNDTAFTLTMDTSFIPNFELSGAYFDGRHVFPLYTRHLYFDPKERALTVEITPDKESYKPGDTATVSIVAKDKQGNPVGDAAVLASVVDEAAFAVQEHSADAVGSLYRAIDAPWVDTYTSYTQHAPTGNPTPSAEGGEGGDATIRKNFKDTAAFDSAVTDSLGRASVSFKMPDNLTTWRLTAQVVGTGDGAAVRAGQEKTGLVVTRPFFLTPVALPVYVVGDDVTVSATAVGGTTETTAVTARLWGDGFDKTISGDAGAPLSFGPMQAGTYTLRLTAKNGTDSDAIEKPLRVVASALETSVTASFDLSKGIDIEPMRYPVTLGFYDGEYELYGRILVKLFCSWGDRSDMRVAHAFASRELGLSTPEETAAVLAGVTSQGGVSLLPYSGHDMLLTALVSAAAPEAITYTRETAQVFRDALLNSEATSEVVTACYLGLAALSEPVLLDIQDLLANPQGLNDEDQLRLVLGLALLGDEDSAESHYSRLTDRQLTQKTGTNGDKWVIAGDSTDQSEQIRKTALTLPLASLLGRPEADGMAAFLLDNDSTNQTTVLELMLYLRHYAPKVPGTASFSYTLGGKTESVILDRFHGTTLVFAKEQLEAADFKVLSGRVTCIAYYTGGLSERKTAPELTLKKTVTPVSDELTVGAVLKVTLTPDFSGIKEAAAFTLEDVIPSCARFTGGDSQNYINRSEQRVSSSVFFDPDDPDRDHNVTYYIRCVLPGIFVQESAVISDGIRWGKTERTTLTIQP